MIVRDNACASPGNLDIGTGHHSCELAVTKSVPWVDFMDIENKASNDVNGTRIVLFNVRNRVKVQRHTPTRKKGTNLMGKFTHSVKRLVKEVADDSTPGGQTKDQSTQTNERLRLASAKLSESYDTAKKALRTLHETYNESKRTRNVFRRYVLLKEMIREVVRLDVQYWLLVEVPKQDKQETVPQYVLRACASLEKSAEMSASSKANDAIRAEDEASRRDRHARFDDMTATEIETENTQLTNDLYRLLKKYTALRNLMKELKADYADSKTYPIFPRYTMLKDMIKDVTRDPDYMEVCHEDPA